MKRKSYSVLIRTFNSELTLADTLRSLDFQSTRPAAYVIVDSGSSDRTLDLVPSGAIVHEFVGASFNYAAALNQGVQYVETEYVLIISSHTSLHNSEAIHYALTLLEADRNVGAAYFCWDNRGALRHELIDRHNFTGFNGLWNTCSLIRTSLIKERGFRPDVFTAEDQEWASWLFTKKNMSVARCSGAGNANNNPRRSSFRKRINEYVSVAYFSNRQLLEWNNLVRIAYVVLTPDLRVKLRGRLLNICLLCRLLECRIRQPHIESRYF